MNPYPLYKEGSGYIAALGDELNALKMIVSRLNQQIQLQQQVNPTYYLSYNNQAVPYDPTAEYLPGNVVYIDYRNTYTDNYTLTSNPTLYVTTGSLTTNAQTGYYGNDNNQLTASVSAGTYLCISYVPPACNSGSVFVDTIIPAYQAAGGAATNNEAQAYRWNGNGLNNTSYYYPVNPPIQQDNPVMTNVYGDYTVQTGQCFWLPLGTPSANTQQQIFWNPRGWWSTTVVNNGGYNAGDVVLYGSGPGAGMFQSLINGNIYYPSNGAYWQQWASFAGALI